MSIDEIIAGCKSHDLRHQRLLYDKYSQRFYAICLRYCKDDQSASAALHAGFLKIYKNINALADSTKLEAWMQRIIVHASIDQIKADKKFTFEEVRDDHFSQQREDDNQPFGDRCLPLLQLLPDGYRLVFSMRILEEMSHKEIAKVLGITESTSRTQLLKARKMLKGIINKKHITIY